MIKRHIIILIITLLTIISPSAAIAQSKPGDIDIYAGIDFNYRDILIRGRFCDLLIGVTPGVKWNLGHHIEVEASAWIPIINQYGPDYKYVKLNTATASWQFAVGNHWKTKITGGVFTNSRFGFDIKTMYAFNSWLAVRAQIGLTGRLTMQSQWEASEMKRLTFLLGPDFWLKNWNTQLSLRGGRYIYGDYGFISEAMRNFKHTSVGVYAQYSNQQHFTGGFKVIIMIPPYKRDCRKVHFRPATNFRLTYCSQGSPTGNQLYKTDPEENERTGWFDQTLLPWGQATMQPDIKPCNKDEKSSENVGIITEDVISTEKIIVNPGSVVNSESEEQIIQEK